MVHPATFVGKPLRHAAGNVPARSNVASDRHTFHLVLTYAKGFRAYFDNRLGMQTQTRSFKITSFTMDPRVFKLLKKTADTHDVAMSGLVNLAIRKLLSERTARQIELMLKREGVRRRRAAAE